MTGVLIESVIVEPPFSNNDVISLSDDVRPVDGDGEIDGNTLVSGDDGDVVAFVFFTIGVPIKFNVNLSPPYIVVRYEYDQRITINININKHGTTK